MALISEETCIRCKGRLWCGLSHCPLYDRMKSIKQMGKDIEAPSPPNYLVGWKGYPRVAVGPSLLLKEPGGEPFDMSLEDFVVLRANQLRTFQVKGIREHEEASLSVNPVLFDVRLRSMPAATPSISASVPAESIVPEDGVKVPGRVYSVVDSYDLKAQEALLRLERYGFNYLVQALSTGNLGLPAQRKMVPTRWAITAVDSVLARKYFSRIRGKPPIRNYELYRMEHWDNRFWVVLIPWSWGFEMLERWYEHGIISDHEYGGFKKGYASNITGAYYAARLEVLKKLADRGRQAAALVIRKIGKKYIYPVGVWHIRESVGRALEGRPESFGSLEELESCLRGELDWENWKKKSVVWRMTSSQSRLENFM